MAEFCHPEFGCDCSNDDVLTEAEKRYLRETAHHIRNEFPATANTLRLIAERNKDIELP